MNLGVCILPQELQHLPLISAYYPKKVVTKRHKEEHTLYSREMSSIGTT